jgi:hypothetical protein
MKALYKYPQAEYPYGWLVEENRNRGVQQPEFELEDTGRTPGGERNSLERNTTSIKNVTLGLQEIMKI